MTDTEDIEVPLVEKYRPESVDEVQGHNTDLKELENWLENFEEAESEAQLLHGDPGIGKTASVYALANDYGYQVYEVNASDSRTTSDIRDIAQAMSMEQLGKPLMVLLDEVDSMSGRANLKPLKEELQELRHPTFLTCNNKHDVPGSIKNQCNIRKFNLGKRSKNAKLKDIVEEEDIDIDGNELRKLADRDNLREAIQDLQRYAQSDSKQVPSKYDDGTGKSIFGVVQGMLKGYYVKNDETPPELTAWLEENLPDRAVGLELAMQMEALSRADKWNGRAERNQKFRFWRYAGSLAEMVPHLKLREPYDGYIKTRYPSARRWKRWNPEGNKPEAEMFRDMTRYEQGEPAMFCNFTEFRRKQIPVLKSLEPHEKQALINFYGWGENEDIQDVLEYSPEDVEENSFMGTREKEEGEEEEVASPWDGW